MNTAIARNYDQRPLVGEARQRVRTVSKAVAMTLFNELLVTGTENADPEQPQHWVDETTDLIMGLLDQQLVNGGIGDLPTKPVRKEATLEELVDDIYRIAYDDAYSAVEQLDEDFKAAEEDGIEISDEEMRLRAFLNEIVEQGMPDQVAVFDNYVDDFLNDQLQRPDVHIPDWLNEAINWDDVYEQVKHESAQVSDPDGNMYVLINMRQD